MGDPEHRYTLLGDENRDLQDEHSGAAYTWADALLCAVGALLGLLLDERRVQYWSLWTRVDIKNFHARENTHLSTV